MIFYYNMIYSPETDNQIRHCSRLQLLSLQQVDIHNDTYSVHNEVLMPVLLFFWHPHERLAASTVVS
jgi:hypothetical protein